MSLRSAAYLLLVQGAPGDVDPTTGKGPEWGKAAPIGLLVILMLAVATFFLIRSMNRNLKKVPASFDSATAANAAPAATSERPISGDSAVTASPLAAPDPALDQAPDTSNSPPA